MPARHSHWLIQSNWYYYKLSANFIDVLKHLTPQAKGNMFQSFD
jgi:hypothetical protein